MSDKTPVGCLLGAASMLFAIFIWRLGVLIGLIASCSYWLYQGFSLATGGRESVPTDIDVVMLIVLIVCTILKVTQKTIKAPNTEVK